RVREGCAAPRQRRVPPDSLRPPAPPADGRPVSALPLEPVPAGRAEHGLLQEPGGGSPDGSRQARDGPGQTAGASPADPPRPRGRSPGRFPAGRRPVLGHLETARRCGGFADRAGPLPPPAPRLAAPAFVRDPPPARS